MDLTSAAEIIASDYAHDEADPQLPTAAWTVLQEMESLAQQRADLLAWVEKLECDGIDGTLAPVQRAFAAEIRSRIGA